MRSWPPTTRSAGPEHLRHRREHGCLCCPEPKGNTPPRSGRRASKRHHRPSEAVFREVAEVLARPKFARVLTHDRRGEILELLTAAALWIEPGEKVRDCRDAKDNRYLELALAARAEVIVSGDEDLLVLDPWRDTRVLRPARFLLELEAGAQGSRAL